MDITKDCTSSDCISWRNFGRSRFRNWCDGISAASPSFFFDKLYNHQCRMFFTSFAFTICHHSKKALSASLLLPLEMPRKCPSSNLRDDNYHSERARDEWKPPCSWFGHKLFRFRVHESPLSPVLRLPDIQLLHSAWERWDPSRGVWGEATQPDARQTAGRPIEARVGLGDDGTFLKNLMCNISINVHV